MRFPTRCIPNVETRTVSCIESRYSSCPNIPPELVVELIMDAQPILSTPQAFKTALTPRLRNVPRTVELLCHRHGEASALKIVRREHKLARQKRSRTSFAFWAAALAELELRRSMAPEDREAK